MLSYKRFVAYIYEYNEEEKTKNKGYVKVEVKNGRCYMNFHLRGLASVKEEVSIYGIIRNLDKINAISLGKCKIQEHNIDWYMDMDANNMDGRKHHLEEFAGIILISDSQSKYGTQWDDEPIIFKKIVFDIQESKLGDELDSKAEQEKELKQVNEIEPTEKPAVNKNPNNSDKISKIGEEETEQEETIKSQEVAQCAPKVKCMRGREEANKMSNKWKELQETFPALEPFEDGGIEECIKIAPADLTRLQRQDWILGNNSFLLHGYYNYHYIILGKVENKDCYILGVPGVFDHQERFMATMFGFPNFKAEKESKLKMGQFGYWYRPIY